MTLWIVIGAIVLGLLIVYWPVIYMTILAIVGTIIGLIVTAVLRPYLFLKERFPK